MNVPKAIQGCNERLKEICISQDRFPGSPLRDMEVGERVAAYSFKEKLPKWAERGTVILRDREDTNGALRYVIQLCKGQAQWKHFSPTVDSVVRRARIHLIPITCEELDADTFVVERFGALQLAADKPQKIYYL